MSGVGSKTGRLWTEQSGKSFVGAGSIDHYFQGRVDDRAGFLGIEVLLQVGRTLDIGEQSRDGLALAL